MAVLHSSFFRSLCSSPSSKDFGVPGFYHFLDEGLLMPSRRMTPAGSMGFCNRSRYTRRDHVSTWVLTSSISVGKERLSSNAKRVNSNVRVHFVFLREAVTYHSFSAVIGTNHISRNNLATELEKLFPIKDRTSVACFGSHSFAVDVSGKKSPVYIFLATTHLEPYLYNE